MPQDARATGALSWVQRRRRERYQATLRTNIAKLQPLVEEAEVLLRELRRELETNERELRLSFNTGERLIRDRIRTKS